MASLGRQARRHGQQLRESGGHRRRGRRAGQAEQAGQGEAAARQVLLPCVLSRAAVDRASALLALEADLRGRPELHALLHASVWKGPASARAAGSPVGHAEHEGHLGRHSAHHVLWQRLERALTQTGGGDEGADADAAAEQAQQSELATGNSSSRKKKRRHRPGRTLSAEERLVLGILSDPRFDFAAKTALPL